MSKIFLYYAKLRISFKKNFYEFLVLIAAISAILINIITKPNYGFDAFIWIPLTDDFFGTIGNSIGIHRPLFAFIAYLFNIIFSIFSISEGWTWRILNYFYYLASVYFCYKGCILLYNSRTIASITALSVALSAQFLANLHVININLHGFFILYFTFYAMMNYIFIEKFKSKKLVLIFSIIFGMLMLGKAHYNIFLAVFLFGIFTFKKKYIKDSLIFFFSVIFVLVFYIVFLKFFDISYSNYEISRSDFSLLERVKLILNRENIVFYSFYSTFLDMIIGSFQNIFRGMGPFYLLGLIYFFGQNLITRVGFYGLIYYLGTALFLYITSFSLARHAGDYSIIAYIGFAFIIKDITEKLKFSENNVRYFLIFIFLFYLLVNSSNITHEYIHGVCYLHGIELYNNVIAVFFDNFMIRCDK